MQRYSILFILFITSKIIFAQEEIHQEHKTRVLFLIDASGSMNEVWKGERKWDMAIHTLSKLIDSFQQNNQKISVGMRLLGHQYHKSLQRCDDTKLEIPFSTNLNEASIYKRLRQITPKGQTPLAYSLGQTEMDFQAQDMYQNIVVLITDGIETCNGDPCDISKKLREKNIFISPYIIGLGIDSLKAKNLECIGKYIDVKDKKVFQTVIKTIFTDISRKTTLEVQLLDSLDNPLNYYVPFSLLDVQSHKDIYSYIYSRKATKSVDTIPINPQFRYTFRFHTKPPIDIDTFQIIRGMHNILKVKISSGTLTQTHIDKLFSNNYLLVDSTGYVLDFIESATKYRHRTAAKNRVDILTHPEYSTKTINFSDNSQAEFEIKNRSTVTFRVSPLVEASIFDANWQLVYNIPTDRPSCTFELLSQDYYLIYKTKNTHSEKTISTLIHLLPQQKYEYLLQ